MASDNFDIKIKPLDIFFSYLGIVIPTIIATVQYCN